jgi:uncharacterized membrane protein YhhN
LLSTFVSWADVSLLGITGPVTPWDYVFYTKRVFFFLSRIFGIEYPLDASVVLFAAIAGMCATLWPRFGRWALSGPYRIPAIAAVMVIVALANLVWIQSASSGFAAARVGLVLFLGSGALAGVCSYLLSDSPARRQQAAGPI